MIQQRDAVHGAWARRSVSIDGGPHFETQTVVWLQAGTRYADVRVPFHPAAVERCFAGRSGWEEGSSYRWTHHLDLEGADSPAADDLGVLAWSGDALVETGEFPTADGAVAYEEIWVPLPGSDGPWAAREAPDACLVRVGDHAITVVDARAVEGGFAACYRRLGPDGWVPEVTIGDGDRLPGPDEAPAEWTQVHAGG